jgi:uncharacterized glyoxalase superfamily protein PhnB
MTTIHFIDGEKGGTGKSWFARTMHHTFATRDITFLGVDADTANPTYRNIYQDARQIPFSLERRSEDMADAIFQLARNADLIVNLPAQVHQAVFRWMQTKDVIVMAKKYDITIKKWWLSDGENDSLYLFLTSLHAYGDGIQHIFVQNEGRCKEWEYFDTHGETQAALRRHQVPVVQLPELSDFRRIRINAERLTFADALVFEEFGILGQAQIGRYLQEAEVAIKAAGAFGAPSDQAMAIARSTMPEIIDESTVTAEALDSSQKKAKPVKPAA